MPLSKIELRKMIRQRKQTMSPEEILRRSELLCRKVLETDAYQAAKTIYGYLSFHQEVAILPLLEQALADGKQVAVPKCFGKEMRFILTDDFSRIRLSPHGVPEPVADSPVASDPHALVIVPGLAFDPEGHRVGYGGGYYDRFFASEPEHPTIALCYDFQLFPRLDTDPPDIPVDTIFWI